MKRLPIIFLFALIVCCGIQCTGSNDSETAVNGDDHLLSDRLEAKFADGMAPPHNPKNAMPPNNVDSLAAFFNDSNYLQYAAAEQLGIEPIADDLALTYHTRRPLVEIGSGEGYATFNLTHSFPFLVPEAARLLDDIGAAFVEKVKKEDSAEGYKLMVTSVLRTRATVKKLQKVNINAVDSSTHMFATTFDIAYNGFKTPEQGAKVSYERLKMILAEVLKEKRDEGRCYVKYEKQTPCFHITVTK